MNLDQYIADGRGRGYIPFTGINSNHRDTNGVIMPEWMMACDDLLSSSITGFEGYGAIIEWRAGELCRTTGSPSGQLLSTAAVQHSNIYIHLINDMYIPTLETKLHLRANIALITIVRLGKVGEDIVPLEEIKYENCKIESMEQRGDETFLSFRPETKEHTYYKYKQDGSKEGQGVSKFNFTTGAGE